MKPKPHHRPRENFMERDLVAVVDRQDRIDETRHAELLRLLHRMLTKHRAGQAK